MGPPIAILGAILTFLAFYIQYRANVEQRRQFVLSLEIQRTQFNTSMESQYQQFSVAFNNEVRTNQLERVESRFFELLSLHKANVDEMRLSTNIEGRRCFQSFYIEFEHIRFTLYNAQKELEPTEFTDFKNNIDVNRMAYNIFFYGLGSKGEATYYKSFSTEERKVFHKAQPTFFSIHENFRHPAKNRAEYEYLPFTGHANILGHYFRHLYQTAKYVVENNLLNPNQKKEYIKTLRAQLSNYEQTMLYFNAIIWFPGQWYNLFINYKLIKNIPFNLASLVVSPAEKYQKEMQALWEAQKKHLFEDQRHMTKYSN